MTWRFRIGLASALPIFGHEIGEHLFDLHALTAPLPSNFIQSAHATPVVLCAGWPFFERGWQSVITRNLNMLILIAIGTGAAG